uniref:Beta 3-glucosyltransferase b n=1 Tax=Cyprinus carpio TaxID=7962 RepID=A0A8C2I2Z0_CYPCA
MLHIISHRNKEEVIHKCLTSLLVSGFFFLIIVQFFPLFSSSLVEVWDVVFVIQSQKNSYHTHRAEQRRTELLHQAQTLNQSSPDVVLLHKLSEYDGNWSILPLFLLSSAWFGSSWFVFLEEETNMNLHNLLQVLSKFKTRKWFLGRPLHDDEPTIIHHCAFSEDPYSFTYPDFMAGWALSCLLAKRTAERVNYEPSKSDFTIDLQHDTALYIWEEGRGPALTVMNEFCSELHSLSSTGDCATTVNTLSTPNCFKYLLCSSFHGDRGGCSQPVLFVKTQRCVTVTQVTLKTLSYCLREPNNVPTISFFVYSYRMVFSRVAVQNILADDMVIGMCLTTLGLPVTHSPLFHQVAYTPTHFIHRKSWQTYITFQKFGVDKMFLKESLLFAKAAFI